MQLTRHDILLFFSSGQYTGYIVGVQVLLFLLEQITDELNVI